MPVYQFYKEQIIPNSREAIWAFISSPENLKKITPPEMGFEITNQELVKKMYPGLIISYKVSPLPGFKTSWVTEITHVREGEYFVDEQRHGPYSIWHHQHMLEEHPKGILMKDIVTYKPPLGILGSLANKLIIRKKLNEIFTFREEAVINIFGAP